jgi:hypothetical protein
MTNCLYKISAKSALIHLIGDAAAAKKVPQPLSAARIKVVKV